MNNTNNNSKIELCLYTLFEMVGRLFEPTIEKISDIVDSIEREDFVKTFVELYELLPEHKKQYVRTVIERLHREICRRRFEIIPLSK